jgi:hypothetical protein
MTTLKWNGGPYLPMLQDSAIQDLKLPLLYDQLSDRKLSEGAMKMLVSKKPTIPLIEMNIPTTMPSMQILPLMVRWHWCLIRLH